MLFTCQHDPASDAVVYRTLGGSFVFRVGCIETITCAGIGDRARWTTGSGALLNEIQNTSDLFITVRNHSTKVQKQDLGASKRFIVIYITRFECIPNLAPLCGEELIGSRKKKTTTVKPVCSEHPWDLNNRFHCCVGALRIAE